jgi:hypothetical protein
MISSNDPNDDFEDLDKTLRVYLVCILVLAILVYVFIDLFTNLLNN